MGNTITCDKDLLNDLITIITPYCKNDALKNVSNETKFIEDLGVNSARLVDIVIDIEDKFNINIDDESADKIRTVGDAISLISSKV
jgi:acyl carrier protein